MIVTMEDLVNWNPSYHHEHRVTEADVEKANALLQAIEASRTTDAPQPGDVVLYTNRHGDFYRNAHIEGLNSDGQLTICEQPYIPWVFVDDGKVKTDTSGGAWSAIPATLKYVGTAQTAFKAWGHCGPCGNGAFIFFAQVNVWRYTEGNPEFTTETHDRFDVTIHDKPVGCGYLVTVTRGATAYTAFRTVEDYRTWLETIRGVERESAWPNSTIVWVARATA